jgi:hypothetical protein
MKPGRELDALVAEKVFGFLWHRWSPEKDATATPDLRGHRFLKPAGTIEQFAAWDSPPFVLASLDDPIWQGDNTEVPPYSTDIAAAHQVLDKVMERAFGVWLGGTHEAGWWCEFALDGVWKAHSGYEITTAPLAICLAALAAVSAEVPA